MFNRRRSKVCSVVTTRIIVCILAIMMMFLLPIGISNLDGVSYGTSKSSTKVTTVRVGYFPNGAFMSKNTDGTYQGYDIEYYYTLAGYANWNIKVVDFNSLDEALAGLKNGKIDMMSGLSITPERSSSYLIASQKMCTAHIAVQVRANDDRYGTGDTSTMKNMTCGILAGSNVVTLYENWCKENGLTPHVVEYATLDARNAALKAKKVDAIAGGSTIEGAQKIAEFPSLDLYFMFNKNKAGLKSQMDRAMSILSLENPTYAKDLFEKYFPATKNTKPSFSAEEKAFIKHHTTVKVALLKDDAPFSSESANGSMKGYLPEYYKHLGKVIGADFKFVPFATKDKACAALKSGKVDILGKTDDDIFDANRRNIILANPYLKTNIVSITRAGNDSVSKAAVPICNEEWVKKTIVQTGSSIKIETKLNSTESLKALKSKKVDAVICTQPAATWLLSKNRASEYVTSAFGEDTWNMTCAFDSSTTGNTLRAILNKTIAVDHGYINQLISSDNLQESADPKNAFNTLPIGYIIALAAAAILLLIIAVIALIIIIKRRKTERALAVQQAELQVAEQANKTRHEFFGTISHDMRTPLNGIVGFTDLALKCDDLGEVRNYLNKIKISGSILSGMVNDTLIISRVENGKYKLAHEPNDIAELIAEISESISQLAREKGVEFENNIDLTCHRSVMVDKLSLQKVFLNLLTNAIKFTPTGGKVTFSCETGGEKKDKEECVFQVADTGIGMSEEFLPHLFEPFAQEDTANAGASGSGLGLSIVKSIVEAMGGSIDVDSKKNKGTTFTIRLSFAEADPTELGPAADNKYDSSCLKGKRALICEDNDLNLEIIKTLLESNGMETLGVENGKLGVEAFKASEPGYYDVVLLDLRMPVMDGNTAAREIRALNRPDAFEVPIFAISADAYPENIEDSLAAGMNGHVSKPIDANELMNLLVNALKA